MSVCLIMFRENGERREFALTSAETTIGRKDDCDIRIPLAEVSRHHTKICVTDEGATLKDLDSANGTYLNNKRIKEEVKLAAGDHVVVGPVVFTVQLDGEPKEPRAVKTKLHPLSAVGKKPSRSGDSGASDHVYNRDEEVDPISALEALASSADQTAIDPFDDEDDIL